MFKLIKVEHQIYRHEDYVKNPSVNNHFALYKFKDEKEFLETLWQLQCEEADRYDGFDEEEQEYADFVQDNSDYIVVDYDPTNPIHALHTGFEDERPEHAVAVKAYKLEKTREDIRRARQRINVNTALAEEYNNKAAKAVAELNLLIQELEKLNEV